MGIGRLNKDADDLNALIEKVDAQAPCTDDDGMGEFRRRYPVHSHLTADQIGERAFVDDELRADLYQFVDDMNVAKERLTQEVDSAIAEAERELNRIRAIRDRARAEGADDEPEPGLLDG